MDVSTINFPVVLTSVTALVVSLGGAAVLASRSKVAKVVPMVVDTMNDMAMLLSMISESFADDVIEQKEIDAVKAKATEIVDQAKAIKTELGM
jgi:hypothetical protein